MNILISLLLFSLFTLSLSAGSSTINSVEKLKQFMVDGQKAGYFPKKVLIASPIETNKLIDVDLDFRRVMHWNMNSRCPNSEDQIILALGSENHAIVCNRGDTAGILGSGDDWIDDATGNDIYYPGAGDDIIDVGSGNDIVIFEEGWGHDTLNMHSKAVDTTKILGYDGSYPWPYTDFIIFGPTVKRSDIVWMDSTLHNLKTGDTIALNTKSVNILFASEHQQDSVDLPNRVKLELSDLSGESMVTSEGLLYIADGNKGLKIVDATSADRLMQISTLVLPGRAMSVVVKEKIAYVAQGDYYLEGKRGWVSIVDVEDPSKPKLLSNLKFGTTIKELVVLQDMLYIASTHYWQKEKRHLYVYDVTDKTKPLLRLKKKLNNQEYNVAEDAYIRSMVYYKKRLYFINQYNRVKAFDISNPIEPKIVSLTALQGIKAVGLKVVNDELMVLEKKHRMTFYQQNKKAQLRKRCSFQTLSAPFGRDTISQNSVVVSGDLLYRAESQDGITVSSISKCRSLTHLTLNKGEKPWPTKLIEIQKYVVSFSVRAPSAVYTFKKGKLYHVAQAMAKGTKKVPKPMSQDQLQTLLYKAALRGNSVEVKRLLSLGANPNIKGHERTTPVEIASRMGQTAALEVLLKHGGKASKKAMMLAALREQDETMKLLERYGVPVTIKDREGCTTLHYIAQDGSVEMVKYLIKKGVAYNATCRRDETPLKWANYGNNCVVIDYLQGLYPKGSRHQENRVCLDRKKEAELARIKSEKALAEKKKFEKVINGKAYFFEPITMRVKAKQNKEYLNMKMLIHNPMYSQEMAKKRNQPAHYLRHLRVTIKDTLLMDATLTPRLSKNPILKAKLIYKPTMTTKPLLCVEDNVGFSMCKAANLPRGAKAQEYHLNNTVDYRIQKPKVWSATTINEAIRQFYGNVKFREGEFSVKMPKLAVNGGSVPIKVESQKELESILVLADGDVNKAVIAFHVPLGQKANYDFRFKARDFGERRAVIVGKGRDGKYYKTVHPFEIAGPPTCDGS